MIKFESNINLSTVLNISQGFKSDKWISGICNLIHNSNSIKNREKLKKYECDLQDIGYSKTLIKSDCIGYESKKEKTEYTQNSPKYFIFSNNTINHVQNFLRSQLQSSLVNNIKFIPSSVLNRKRNPNIFFGVNNYLSHTASLSTSSSCHQSGPPKIAECLRSALNMQILEEMKAGYTYLSMANFFARTDIALPGTAALYRKMYKEEFEHGNHLINYLIMRGGTVELFPIEPPRSQDWQDIKTALSTSIQMEQSIKEKLVCIYEIAEQTKDFGLSDLIQSTFITEQDSAINELTRLLTRLLRMKVGSGCGCSEFLFDRELFKIFGKDGAPTEDAVGHETPKNAYI